MAFDSILVSCLIFFTVTMLASNVRNVLKSQFPALVSFVRQRHGKVVDWHITFAQPHDKFPKVLFLVLFGVTRLSGSKELLRPHYKELWQIGTY